MLGRRPVIKVAADYPGMAPGQDPYAIQQDQFGQWSDAAAQNRAYRGGKNWLRPGPGQATNRGQLGVAALQSLFGPGAAALGSAALPFLNLASPQLAAQLREPLEAVPGTNPDQNRELNDAQQAALLASMSGYGASVRRNLGPVLGSVAQFPMLPEEWKGKILAAQKGLESGIINDQMVGTFLKQLVQAFPTIGHVLEQADPHFLYDFEPIAQATMALGKGKFDRATFDGLNQKFQALYRNGGFGGVPAQTAMSSMMAALERGGSDVTDAELLKRSSNVHNAALAIQQAGMAATYGDALRVAQVVSPGVLQDPSKAMQFANWVGTYAKQKGLDPQQLTGELAQGMQRGMSPQQTMAGVLHRDQLNDQFRPNPVRGQELTQSYDETLGNLGRSATLRFVQAAYQNRPELRNQIDAALQNGDERVLNQIAARARTDSRTAGLIPAQASASFLAKLSPQAVESVMASDAEQFAGNAGGSRAARVFRDPKRLAAVAAGEYEGLTTEQKRFFSSAQGQRALASGITRANPVGPAPAPKPVQIPKPVGAPYPTATAPAKPEPAPPLTPEPYRPVGAT